MNQSKWRPRRPLWGGSVRTRFLHALLAILLLPSVSAAAPADDAASIDSVVVSPRLGLAFAMRAGGGIEAIDLASGAVRWRSDKAVRPLAVAGNRLVAQADPGGAGALALVTLDTRNGAERAKARVPIDAAVTATPVDTAGATFRAWAAASGAGVVVRWEHSSLSGGASAQGYLPAADEGQAPSVGGGEATVSVGASSMQVEAVGGLRATTEQSAIRPALQEATVAGISGERQFLSADGRHVLVADRARSAEFRMDQHLWNVFDRSTGAKLGSFRSVVSAAPFVVIGRTLYYTSPPHVARRGEKLVRRGAMLRAVDLGSGSELWAKTVRDSAFRGPFPP